MRVVCLLLPTAGTRKAPAPLPVPIVTGPAMIPLPPRVPVFTLSAPVPVAEPLLLPAFKIASAHCSHPGVGVRAAQGEGAGAALGQTPLSWITPEKVVLWLLLPMVRLLVPRKTEPAPANDPMVTPGALWVLISNSALPQRLMLAVPPLDFLVKITAPPSEPATPPLAVCWPPPPSWCRRRSGSWRPSQCPSHRQRPRLR